MKIKAFIYNTSLMILLSTLVFSCKNAPEKTPESIAENTDDELSANEVRLNAVQIETAEIKTDTMSGLDIAPKIILRGNMTLSPQYHVSVHAPVEGIIRDLKIMPGMRVQKGQSVLSIEDFRIVQLQQDYLTVKTAVAYAEKEFERQKELFRQQAVSEKSYLQAEESYKMKAAELSGLKAKIKLLNIDPEILNNGNIQTSVKIYSPVSGYVTDVPANNGKYIQPQDELASISDEQGLYLVLKAFENDLQYVSVGKEIYAYSNTAPEKRIKGVITSVNRQIRAEGYTEVYSRLTENHAWDAPGSFLNAEIIGQKKNVQVLPEVAIVRYDNRNYIFVESQDQTYTMQEVETGLTDNGYTEILNPKAFSGKKIVVQGAYTLLMKLKNVDE